MTPSLGSTANDPANPAANRWRAWSLRAAALMALAALCLIAAWWGNRQQQAQALPGRSPEAQVKGLAPSVRSNAEARRDGDVTETVDDVAAEPRQPALQEANALRWPFWEFRLRQPLPPREPSLTPLTWRLIGASLSGGKWSVIILRQGKTEPEYLTVGEDLPGGFRIDAINDQDVTVSKGKQVMVLSYLGSR